MLARLLRLEHGRWLGRHGWRPHPGHRAVAHLVLLDQPAKELLEAPVAVGDRGRETTGVLEGDEQTLDMFAADRPDVARLPAFGQKALEMVDGVEVRLGRPGRLVRCLEAARRARLRGTHRKADC